METLEQCAKSVQSQLYRHHNDVSVVSLVSLLLTLNRSQTVLVFPLLTLNKQMPVGASGSMRMVQKEKSLSLEISRPIFLLRVSFENKVNQLITESTADKAYEVQKKYAKKVKFQYICISILRKQGRPYNKRFLNKLSFSW